MRKNKVIVSLILVGLYYCAHFSEKWKVGFEDLALPFLIGALIGTIVGYLLLRIWRR